MTQLPEWMRIDLHIHTDKSRKTKLNDYKGNFDVTTLKTKLTDNQVRIFSLTDHNIINVQAYKDYVALYNADMSANKPFLLLGAELDIWYDPTKPYGNKNKYHAIIIFSDDIKSDPTKINIISDALEAIYSEQDTAQGNIQNRHTTIEEIIKKFYDREFTLILHGMGGNSIFENLKRDKAYENNQRWMIAFTHAGLEKVPEEAVGEFNKGFYSVIKDGLKAEDFIAYMGFSDNHNIEQYPMTHMADITIQSNGQPKDTPHEFTYIKGIPNYESLRLAFVDPIIRIKLESEVLLIRDNIRQRGYIKELKLEKIKLSANSTTIQDSTITFSPHFNAIIGGSSSGKSLLSDIIRNKVSCLRDSDKPNKKYGLTNESDSKIKMHGDTDWSDDINIENEKIVHLAQGEIIEYFHNGDLSIFAKQSNKTEAYKVASDSFGNKRSIIQTLAGEISEKYENVKLAKQQLSSCKILQSDIEVKFGGNWSFPPVNYNLKDADHGHKITNLESLVREIGIFRANWSDTFTTVELVVIKSFEDLLQTRNDIINKEKLLRAKQTAFIDTIPQIINNANNTATARKLCSEPTAKNDSNAKIDGVAETAAKIFYHFWEWKKVARRAQTTSLSHREIIQINSDVDIGLESSCGFNNLTSLILDKVLTGHNVTDDMYMAIHNDNHQVNRQGARGDVAFLTKIKNVLQTECYSKLEKPVDFLVYKNQGGSESKNNSPGRNCEYYLKTIFDNDNIKTIIIDQPEDSLGATFISEDNGLIEIIRKYKLEKQIFLVTHNASVVVYGDAESIILAKNDTNKITYTPILMEDGESAMKEICTHLDGGEKVFENRRRKYNIKKMK